MSYKTCKTHKTKGTNKNQNFPIHPRKLRYQGLNVAILGITSFQTPVQSTLSGWRKNRKLFLWRLPPGISSSSQDGPPGQLQLQTLLSWPLSHAISEQTLNKTRICSLHGCGYYCSPSGLPCAPILALPGFDQHSPLFSYILHLCHQLLSKG